MSTSFTLTAEGYCRTRANSSGIRFAKLFSRSPSTMDHAHERTDDFSPPLARWLPIFSVIVASPLAHADSLQDVLDTEGEPYRDLAGAPIVTAQNILLMMHATRGERLATVEQDGRTCVWQ